MFSRFRRRRVKWLPLLGITSEGKEALTAWRYVGLGCLLVTALVLNQLSNFAASEDSFQSNSFGFSRRLLAAANDSSEEDTGHGPEWERCDFEKETSKGAWIFSHTICILIIFIALAIVCDDFFVPSLELISEKLQLSEDVAGATFMAAGSSAPELFTSVAGVIVETDVGVGTIVGSAVFNLLIIIALTAALAGQELHLDWRPLMRDAFFYAMSIGCFIGFAWDGFFVHYEAVILLMLYTAYIILMVFNPRLMDWMGTWKQCCGSKVEPSDEEDVKDADPEKGKEALDDRKFSLSGAGGHAKRLQIHKSSLTNELQTPDKHIFHHHRGSVAGVLMLHNPTSRPHHKDGRENSLHHKTNGDTVRPAGKAGHLAKSNDIELQQRRNSVAESTSSGDMLLPAITLPAIHSANELSHKSPTSPISTVPNLPTISSDSGEDTSSRNSEESLNRTAQTTATSSVNTHRLSPVEQPNNNNRSAADDSSGHVTVTPKRSTNENAQFSPTNQGGVASSHLHNGVRKSSVASRTILEEKENGDVAKDDEEKGSEGSEDEDDEKTIQMCPCLPCCCPVRTWPPDCSEACEQGGCINWIKLVLRWVLFIPAFPFAAIFSWTIPDCSKENLKKFYLVSFLMSVFWIAVLSFGMVTLVGRTGCILNVDTYIMGLVVIAIGTSIPDALSSVLVARDGYGDMAVSNAIGSNVFDINLGLGLPFIIRIAIDVGEPISLLAGEEWAEFYSGHMPIIPHAKFGFILLLILAIALTIFTLFKFRLIKAIGITFVVMYVLFLIYAFMQELYCVRKKGFYC